MAESEYTFKANIGAISIEAHGPKEFVQPIYDSFKPILEKEIKNILKSSKPPEVEGAKGKDEITGRFQRKASILDFYSQKKPTSDIQAAALVAFFYSEIAEQEERSSFVDAEILKKGFKACNHPMPDKIDQTLRNAKNYGYLDSAGEIGKFKLTPTGFNLVAHSLPIADGSAVPSKKKQIKRTRSKK
ncbi:MAG: hypothetical protein AB1728_14860 [Bacteroidota bacterium]